MKQGKKQGKHSAVWGAALLLLLQPSSCVQELSQGDLGISEQPIGWTTKSDVAALERSVFEQINQYRLEQGLSALVLNADISQQARQHSQTMASRRTLSHDGFDQRIAAIEQWIPYRSAAENVAYNQGYAAPDRQAVDNWLDSPGHLKNIVGEFNLTGIGVAQNQQGEYYLTQIFILQP